MTRLAFRCDDEGPGSRKEICEYVEAVLRDNFDSFKPGAMLSCRDDDAKRRKLANGMVYSILHRLGFDQITNLDTGELT